MLGRLRITERLSLLLMLPMAAVVLISVPFVVDRVDAARGAGAVSNSAREARAVGAVVQELQQERLLALAYLGSTRLDRAALVSQAQQVTDRAAELRTALEPRPGGALATALDRLTTLTAVRRSVLRRAARATDVQRTYHDLVVSLVDGLRLTDQPDADVTGLRQMAALDALLRTDEEVSRVGAALVIGASDPLAARKLAADAAVLGRMHLTRFQQQAKESHTALLAVSIDGPSARWTLSLAGRLTNSAGTPATLHIDDALSAAQTGIAIRRIFQDRIESDLAAQAAGRATAARAAVAGVAAFAVGLLVFVIWLGMAVSRSVAGPLRRVTTAAGTVADLASRELVRVADAESDDTSPPRLAAVTVRTSDEIGELASAFNRVQATAALLMEQQLSARHNVAVMFANIARRTRSLVARQLAQIHELERDEPDGARLAKLNRLDQITTRLRRSADSLLVISGTREEARIAPPTPLANVIRAAAAEVEGYQSVQVKRVCAAIIAADAVADLTLLLAELMENATAFSPPGVPVEVSTALGEDGLLIQVVDHGIGMLPERINEENRRLVERERLDVAPTTVLGLFVVGRLARRHGIAVRLAPTPVTGVTAELLVPATLFTVGAESSTAGAGERRAATGTGRAALPGGPPRSGRPVTGSGYPGVPGLGVVGIPAGSPGFPWFRRPEPASPAPKVAPGSAGPNGGTTGHAGRAPGSGPTRLQRRHPGQSLPEPALAPGTPYATSADAGTGAGPQPTGERSPSGLLRRRPGEHLAEQLRSGPRHPGPSHSDRLGTVYSGHSTSDSPAAPARDPEAERDALRGYLDGLTRADNMRPDSHDDRS